MYKKNLANNNNSKGGSSTSTSATHMDIKMSMKDIMKDIELLGTSNMTWKQRKELENRKVVSLGGKPPKKHRLPLSVARVMMKKQKQREEIKHQSDLILGRFGGKLGGSARRSLEKRRPEDMVLKASEGHFKNGVLDVKHLLHPTPSRDYGSDTHMVNKGRREGSGKKNKGKKKRGSRKRH
ncbi:hypothetical protein CFOL_v3_08304 [Cephalotus follicularis]|uniref:Uncharacterized protein n=1 Tax=Cephalotus follicularis TaxID=3775 RepID=A0A1Q3BA64_CEPFO|nr:hypothetical protein CFOL_v3_08304 [Cephalotus follicularis]